MAINFPTSPAVNDTHTDGITVWKWDGAKWNISAIGSAGPGLELILDAVDIGSTATFVGQGTVTDSFVTPASKIMVGWGDVTAGSQNSPEFDHVTFLAIPGTGNFVVKVFSKTPISGLFEIQYISS